MSGTQYGWWSLCARAWTIAASFMIAAAVQAQPRYQRVPLPEAMQGSEFRVREMRDVNSAGVSVGLFWVRGEPGGTEEQNRSVAVDAGGQVSFLPIPHERPSSVISSPTAISDTGVVVGIAEWRAANGTWANRAGRVDAAGQFAHLDLPQGFSASTAYGVNKGGVAVGNVYWLEHPEGRPDTYAARWDAEGRLTVLGHAGTQPGEIYRYSTAYGVNDSGEAAGFAQRWVDGQNLGVTAVRWKPDGTIVPFPGQSKPGGTGASAINKLGMVIGAGTPGAFRWDRDGAVVRLEDRPEWLGRELVDIDDSGLVVGNVNWRELPSDTLVNRGVVWDVAGRVFDLGSLVISDDPVTVHKVSAVSSNGIILAATGEGWALLYPVPEPSILTAVVAGVAWLLARHRGRIP